jgi:CspA family cold shock protein
LEFLHYIAYHYLSRCHLNYLTRTKRINIKTTGTVKWYNSTKGYGFIAPDNGSKDIFIHRSAVEEAGLDGLNDNQKIKFEIISSKGKESAENIELI